MPLAIKRLANDTRAFWVLSRAFNGRSDVPTTVEGALKRLGKIQDGITRQNPLLIRVENLLDSIIHNSAPKRTKTGRFKSKVPQKSNLPKPIKEAVEN